METEFPKIVLNKSTQAEIGSICASLFVRIEVLVLSSSHVSSSLRKSSLLMTSVSQCLHSDRITAVGKCGVCISGSFLVGLRVGTSNNTTDLVFFSTEDMLSSKCNSRLKLMNKVSFDWCSSATQGSWIIVHWFCSPSSIRYKSA